MKRVKSLVARAGASAHDLSDSQRQGGGVCSSASTASSGSCKSPEEPSSNSGTWACQWESEPAPYTLNVWSYLVHYVPDILSFATLRSSVFAPWYLCRWHTQRILTRPESLLGSRIRDPTRPLAPSKVVAEARRLEEFTTDGALFSHGGKSITLREPHSHVKTQIGRWRRGVPGVRDVIFVE